MRGEFALAVHALVFLNHKKTRQSSAALAENTCTNAARVRKVMGELNRAGLVGAKEGCRDGGYFTCENCAGISLLQILDALGDEAVKLNAHTGDTDMDCLIASGMSAVMDDVCGNLNTLCRERLAQITVGDIDRRIFGGADE